MRIPRDNGDNLPSCNKIRLRRQLMKMAFVLISYGCIHHSHFMVKHLRLARLSLRDKRLVQDIKHILANAFKLGFDLLAIVTNGANVLIRSFRLLFLLNRGNYTPGSTSSPNDVLIRNRKEVPLIDSKLTPNLGMTLTIVWTKSWPEKDALCSGRWIVTLATSCDRWSVYMLSQDKITALTFIYVTISINCTDQPVSMIKGTCQDCLTIITFGLLAQPREESLAIASSIQPSSNG